MSRRHHKLRFMGLSWWGAFRSFSGVLPVLALDYAANRYMADGLNKSFADLHTFTRASAATHRDINGLIVTAASGAHRIDHDVSGNRLGLLIEEERENLCLWSDDWTNGAYDTVTTMTVAKDQTGADGVSNSASSLLATSGNAIVTQSITNSNATRVYSVHIKRITGTGNIELTQDGGSTWLDIKALINSSTYTQVATASASVTNPVVGIRIVTDTDQIAVQFGNSEIGAFPTSPRTTTTVAVTRKAESVSVAVSGFAFDATKGAFYGQAGGDSHIGGDQFDVIVGTNVSAREFLRLSGSPGDDDAGSSVLATAGNVATAGGSGSWITGMKMAMSYDSANTSVVVNGETVATGAHTTDLGSVTSLQVGTREGTSRWWNSHIQQVSYFNVTLSNADIDALSAP